MKTIRYPSRDSWPLLLKRPVFDFSDIESQIEPILNQVKNQGDQLVKALTRKYDGVYLENLQVSEAEILEAGSQINPELKEAIQLARRNIETFHRFQAQPVKQIETFPGITCWQKWVPIQSVGLYIPGGSAPLFSTILMLAIPAQIAGCQEIVLCSPPDTAGKLHPAVLYTAQLLGVKHIFKVGGAQAIAAMAFGTETIPRVDKIFGPGNQYVTVAKQLVSKRGIAIDLPAGPSEVVVLADAQANPEFVAIDLLSQAEHGPDSQVILVTDSTDLLEKVTQALEKQLQELPRRVIARQALKHSKIVLVKSLEEGLDFINEYAPEHLILLTPNASQLAEKVKNAGSVFIGAWTPEAAGDYASGTNHTLPTNGYARAFSGVSLESFMKKITFQRISFSGLQQIGPAIETMAAAEGLDAHRKAVSLRLQNIDRMEQK